MFTLKLYQADKLRIVECVSVTVYRWENGSAQVTIHEKIPGFDTVACVGDPPVMAGDGSPIYDRAILENAAGKTTEIINAFPATLPGNMRAAKTLAEMVGGRLDGRARALSEPPPGSIGHQPSTAA